MCYKKFFLLVSLPISELSNNMSKGTKAEISHLEKLSLSVTQKVGSIPSLIIHTIGFVGIFSLQFFGFGFDQIMLILTTIVSLEAIYLSIFIQMTVNRHTETLSEVSEDVEELSEDVDEISEDVEGIQKHVEDIKEDVEEISEDVEGIEKEVKEIGDDVDEISEDVEDISDEMAEDEVEEEKEKEKQVADMRNIEQTLRELLKAVEQMKK